MNEPKLRFKGFTDDWKVRKLKEFATKVSDKNTSRKYNDVLTDSARYGVVDQGDFFDKNIANDENVDRYTVVHPNDYMYNPRISKYASYGPVRRNKLNKTGIASPMYLVFQTDGTVDNSFLDNYFIGDAWHRYIYSHGNTGARADRIAIKDDDFMSMPIPMPAIAEQRKIGSFFNNLDRQIKIQSNEVEALKISRQAYLQKLFPDGNSTRPESRLNGFDGDWHHAKMEDLLEYEQPTNYLVQSDDYVSTGTPVLTANKSFVLGRTKESNRYDKGECIIFDDFTEEFKYVDFPFMIKSSAIKILTPKPGNDLKFIFNLFKKTHFISEGHTRHYISTVQPQIVSVPDLEEQQALADFFTKLDKQVNLAQDKLEHLKNQKKGYLQKMFI